MRLISSLQTTSMRCVVCKMCVHMGVCVRACMCVCAHTRVCVCVCVCVCVYDIVCIGKSAILVKINKLSTTTTTGLLLQWNVLILLFQTEPTQNVFKAAGVVILQLWHFLGKVVKSLMPKLCPG